MTQLFEPRLWNIPCRLVIPRRGHPVCLIPRFTSTWTKISVALRSQILVFLVTWLTKTTSTISPRHTNLCGQVGGVEVASPTHIDPMHNSFYSLRRPRTVGLRSIGILLAR